MLEADLRHAHGEVGFDAASAAFKTYPLFHTDRYFGIDVDRDAIEQGRRNHPEALGIVGDIATLDLPPRSVDVCVSTNTLHWLRPEQRREAERRLIELVKPDGLFVLECARDEMLAGTLGAVRAQFTDVDVRYFGIALSRRYESWLHRRAALEWRPGPMRVVRMGIAMVLSWAEFVLPHSPATRGFAYIRARGRRVRGPVNPFEVDPARIVGDGIYAAS
jgi:hypothetical protein